MMVKHSTSERCYPFLNLEKTEEEILGEKQGGESYLMEVSTLIELHMDPDVCEWNCPGSQKTIFSPETFHIGEFLYKGL